MTTKKNPLETRKVIVTIGISLALIVIVTGLYVLYQPKGGAVGKAITVGSDGCAVVGPDEGLVAWWKGEVDTLDSSSSGTHDGTWSGTAAYGAGKVEQALDFSDNVNDHAYVDIDSEDLDITGAFTIEGWIYPKTNTITGTIVHNHGSGNGYKLVLENFKVKFTVKIIQAESAQLSMNEFHHFAAVYEPSNKLKLYVDNLPTESGSNGHANAGTNQVSLKIGGGVSNGNIHHDFDGLIDELSIYNRALSDDEIAAIYNAGSNGKCTTSTVTEICSNSADDDNDGATDCNDSDCNGNAACPASSAEICDDSTDNDNDDLTDCADTVDCSSAGNCQEAETCNPQDPDCTNTDCFSNPSCQNEDCATGAKRVAWSYTLPADQELLDAGNAPANVDCCKPDECATASACQGINSLDAGNLCDADRNWHQCTTALEGTRGSDGSYECDNQKWEVVCQEATKYKLRSTGDPANDYEEICDGTVWRDCDSLDDNKLYDPNIKLKCSNTKKITVTEYLCNNNVDDDNDGATDRDDCISTDNCDCGGTMTYILNTSRYEVDVKSTDDYDVTIKPTT
ncbi:MAG: LamG domain-containing protein [Nanoarchaeota archaeon]